MTRYRLVTAPRRWIIRGPGNTIRHIAWKEAEGVASRARHDGVDHDLAERCRADDAIVRRMTAALLRRVLQRVE